VADKKEEQKTSDFTYFLIGLGVLAVVLFGVIMIPVSLGIAGVYAMVRRMIML
jgi:hypothetical protein